MTRCSVCHRPLEDPKSIRFGMGEVCRNKHHADMQRDEEFSDRFEEGYPFVKGLIMRRDGQGVITNVPHLVVHHSQNGFEFGYGGSGPADLALNICQLYLNMTNYEGQVTKCFSGECWTLAWLMHQDFKRTFIAGADRNGEEISFARIDAWFKEHVDEDLLEQCSMVEEGALL